MEEEVITGIFGYIGFGNAGDEIIAHTVIQNLKLLHPKIKIVVFTNNSEFYSKKYNVITTRRNNLLKILTTLKKIRLLIISGGLFQDKTSSLSLYFYLLVIVIAKIMKVKIFLYGIDLVPLNKKINRFLVDKILSRVDYITVRSKECFEIFKDKSRVNFAPDPAFSLNYTPNNLQKNHSGIVIKSIFNSVEEDLKFWFGLYKFLEKIDTSPPILFSFFPKQEKKLINKLKTTLWSGPPQNDIYEFKDVENLLEIFETTKFIVSARLHGLILGCILNIPFIGINVDPKIENFINQTDSIYISPNSNSETMNQQILGFLKNKESFLEKLKQKNEDFKKLSYFVFRNVIKSVYNL